MYIKKTLYSGSDAVLRLVRPGVPHELPPAAHQPQAQGQVGVRVMRHRDGIQGGQPSHSTYSTVGTVPTQWFGSACVDPDYDLDSGYIGTVGRYQCHLIKRFSEVSLAGLVHFSRSGNLGVMLFSLFKFKLWYLYIYSIPRYVLKM